MAAVRLVKRSVVSVAGGAVAASALALLVLAGLVAVTLLAGLAMVFAAWSEARRWLGKQRRLAAPERH